jgi:hypothetical protein
VIINPVSRSITPATANGNPYSLGSIVLPIISQVPAGYPRTGNPIKIKITPGIMKATPGCFQSLTNAYSPPFARGKNKPKTKHDNGLA